MSSSKFFSRIATLYGQGKRTEEIALIVLLSVMRRKRDLVAAGQFVDGSWQSSLAWMDAQIKDQNLRESLRDAILRAFGDKSCNDHAVRRLIKAVTLAEKDIDRAGFHRRDQAIITVRDSAYSAGTFPTIAVLISEDAHPAIENTEIFKSRFQCEKIGFMQSIVTDLMLSMGENVRGKIRWHQAGQIKDLADSIKEILLENEKAAEISFVARTDKERRVALSLARVFGAAWNLPCYHDGDADLMYIEAAKQALLKQASCAVAP